jgi:MarR family transcriptional regulator, transcriptional regulator for hemolysin
VTESSPFQYERADESPSFLLWKLAALWQERVMTALRSFGLTQTQYAILASLRWFEEHGELPTQQHLGDHARIDKMTLSKAIRKLEGAGLVTRQDAPHDARATQVGFTTCGRRIAAKAVVAVVDADETFFAGLEADQLRSWVSLTGQVIERQAITEPAES